MSFEQVSVTFDIKELLPIPDGPVTAIGFPSAPCIISEIDLISSSLPTKNEFLSEIKSREASRSNSI